MKLVSSLIVVLTCLLSGCVSHSIKESSVVSSISDNVIVLTVPASKLILSLPQHEMIEGQHDSKSYRYFLFQNVDSGLNVSGWFEPDSQFLGVEDSWVTFLSRWPGSKPVDVEMDTIGEWSVVKYKIPLLDCLQPNAKVHLVRDGTWIELHISGKCNDLYSYQELEAYIANIRVNSKDG